jgi:hypothetical protein
MGIRVVALVSLHNTDKDKVALRKEEMTHEQGASAIHAEQPQPSARRA